MSSIPSSKVHPSILKVLRQDRMVGEPPLPAAFLTKEFLVKEESWKKSSRRTSLRHNRKREKERRSSRRFTLVS